MRKLLLSVTFLLSTVLMGCSGEAEIDGTNTDTMRQSWQEMYSTVPESERESFIKGSGLLVLDSVEEIYSSLDRLEPWSPTAYVDLSTDIIHRNEYGSALRNSITEGFNGKTRSDIIDFSESSGIELKAGWIAKSAVEDFLK